MLQALVIVKRSKTQVIAQQLTSGLCIRSICIWLLCLPWTLHTAMGYENGARHEDAVHLHLLPPCYREYFSQHMEWP